jgi:transcriptional regulator with XRE-family HTH domain
MYGAHIAAARERAGLSPAEVAKRVGYASADSIYKIEADKNSASLEALDKIAEACGLLVGDLLPNSGGAPVADLFQPLMAAMMGLDEQTQKELILNLAGQARVMAGWRRRDEPEEETARPTRRKPKQDAESEAGTSITSQ